MSPLWIAIVALVSIYCVAQAIRDFRRGDRLMAVIGLFCVLALCLTPIQTDAFKLDLPPTAP